MTLPEKAYSNTKLQRDLNTLIDHVDSLSGTIPTTADVVSISDSGGYYSGANVEEALQEVGGDLTPLLTRILTAAGGLSGGGTLEADRSFAVNTGDGVTLDGDNVTIDLATTSGLTKASGLAVNVGNGLEIDSDTVKVDLTATSGLEFSGGDLQLADSVAGDGLSIASKALAVSVGNGLEIDTDVVKVDLVASGGLEFSGGDVQVDQAFTPTWTGAHTFQSTITSYSIEPAATDSYDLGSSSKLWQKLYASELEAVLLVEEAIQVLGGWLIVGHDEGTLPSDLDSADDTCDFGKSMTVGDFVLMRANNNVEYFEVGANVSGTTYKIGADASGSRDLDGSGANNWPAGTVFLVLGQDGDGRIELKADSTPTLSILEQGATYDVNDIRVLLGDLNGEFGISSEKWGIGIGDYSGGNYFRYDPTNGLELNGGGGDLSINNDGLIFSSASTDYNDSHSIVWNDASASKYAQITGWFRTGTVPEWYELDGYVEAPAGEIASWKWEAQALDGGLNSADAEIYIQAITDPDTGTDSYLDIWVDTIGFTQFQGAPVRIEKGLYVGAIDTAPPDDMIRVDKGLFAGGGTPNSNGYLDAHLYAEASGGGGVFCAEGDVRVASNAYLDWTGPTWKALGAGKAVVWYAQPGSDYALAVYADDTTRSADDALSPSVVFDVAMDGHVSASGYHIDNSGEKTISSGAITITHPGWYEVDTEGDAATDDLDTITYSGVSEGDIVLINAINDARTIVAKHGTGNLNLDGDCSLTDAQSKLALIYHNSEWDELYRTT